MYNRTSSSVVQSHSSIYSKAFLTGLIIAAGLIVATNVYAGDPLTETTAFGVNKANGAMYRINFDDTDPGTGGDIDELVSANQNLSGIEGLAITETLTGFIAYLVDTNQSRIWACTDLPVFGGDLADCNIVSDPSFGDGPTQPVSIEVLVNGDVIVATAGNSASGFSEIWLFPHPGCPPPAPPNNSCLPTGLIAPVVVDESVTAGGDAGPSVRNLEQLHVHTQSGGDDGFGNILVSAGDVSVVGFNPSVWLKYSGAVLAALSQAAINGVDPLPDEVEPVTMAVASSDGVCSDTEFAFGENPAGIAALPGSDKMLISVKTGEVQRWDLDGNRFDVCNGTPFLGDLGNTAFGLASISDGTSGKLCLSNNNGGIYSLYDVDLITHEPNFEASVTTGVNAVRDCEFSALQVTDSGLEGDFNVLTVDLLGTTPIELLGEIGTEGPVGVNDCTAVDPRYHGGGVYGNSDGSGATRDDILISDLEGSDCQLADSSFLPANLVCAPHIDATAGIDEALCVLVTVGFSGALNGLTTAAVLFENQGAAVNNCIGPIETRTRQGWTTLTGQGEPPKFANDGFIDDVTVTCNRVRSGTIESSLHIGPLLNLDLPQDQLDEAILHLSTVINGATSLNRREQRNLQKLVKGIRINRNSNLDRIEQARSTAEQIALDARVLFASDAEFERGLAIQARALRVGFILFDEFRNIQGDEYTFPEDNNFICTDPTPTGCAPPP